MHCANYCELSPKKTQYSYVAGDPPDTPRGRIVNFLLKKHNIVYVDNGGTPRGRQAK